MNVAFYLRVSTDEQSVENQLADLTRWAQAGGHNVVNVYRDEGISGAKGRDQRPALDAMMKDAARRKFQMIAAWSLDRIGRSLKHLVTLPEELTALGIELFLYKDAIDTTTASGRFGFHVLAALAEFERARIRERSLVGQQRAWDAGKRKGRPPTAPIVVAKRDEKILELIGEGYSVRAIAKQLRCSWSAVTEVRKAALDGGR